MRNILLLGILSTLVGSALAADTPAQPAPKRPDAGHYFEKLDADHNGSISREEAKGHARLEKDFDTLDANHDGQITQEEFRAQMKAKHEQGAGKERFQARWDQADADHDGQLSRAEVEKGMPHLAKRFDQLDSNKDGKLSLDELRAGHKPRGEAKPKQG